MAISKNNGRKGAEVVSDAGIEDTTSGTAITLTAEESSSSGTITDPADGAVGRLPVVEMDWIEFVRRVNTLDMTNKSLHKIALGGGRITLAGTEHNVPSGHKIGITVCDEDPYVIWTDGRKQTL